VLAGTGLVTGDRLRTARGPAGHRTTCHPDFSARGRLFVHAVLVNNVKTY
jgi:hypothetical protein